MTKYHFSYLTLKQEQFIGVINKYGKMVGATTAIYFDLRVQGSLSCPGGGGPLYSEVRAAPSS